MTIGLKITKHVLQLTVFFAIFFHFLNCFQLKCSLDKTSYLVCQIQAQILLKYIYMLLVNMSYILQCIKYNIFICYIYTASVNVVCVFIKSVSVFFKIYSFSAFGNPSYYIDDVFFLLNVCLFYFSCPSNSSSYSTESQYNSLIMLNASIFPKQHKC